MRNEDILKAFCEMVREGALKDATGEFSVNMLKGSLSRKIAKKEYVTLDDH